MKIQDFKPEFIGVVTYILGQLKDLPIDDKMEYTDWHNTLSTLFNFLWVEKLGARDKRFKMSNKNFIWLPLIATVISLGSNTMLENEHEDFVKKCAGFLKKERNAKEFVMVIEAINIIVTAIVGNTRVLDKIIKDQFASTDEITYPLLIEAVESIFEEKKNYPLIIAHLDLTSQVLYSISLKKVNFVMLKILFPYFEEIPDKSIFEKNIITPKNIKFIVALNTTLLLLKNSRVPSTIVKQEESSPKKENPNEIKKDVQDPKNLSRYKKKILYLLSSLLINFDTISSTVAKEDKIYIILSSILIQSIPDAMPLAVSENQLVNFLSKNLIHPNLGRIVEYTFQRLIEGNSFWFPFFLNLF